ncbi:hypothetical protein E2C01_011594 [Portunus trituberculatus]|uniref:Uncharacterized protein n=1 Tax=Portunus trituberculatus TaxID=210409 RepID=A0A5B7DBS9_PORTR|nr:hypothetical protein [Portunus trituberculatus]
MSSFLPGIGGCRGNDNDHEVSAGEYLISAGKIDTHQCIPHGPSLRLMVGERPHKYYSSSLAQAGRAGAARLSLMDDFGPCGFRQHLGAAPRYLQPDLQYLLQVSQPAGSHMFSEILFIT